jgi:hypothetical protein
MTAAQKEVAEAWGDLGPAMRNLPSDRWRRFVRALVSDERSFGVQSRAYRAAGFAGGQKTQAVNASRMVRDDRVIAAIAEEAKKVVRGVGYGDAVRALMHLVRNPDHREHGRALALLLERADPTVTRQETFITHRVEDADAEALEELRALRALDVTRQKLTEVFGGNYLPRLERLEAAAAGKAKVIDAVAVEVETDE